jgi:hypothetical protein
MLADFRQERAQIEEAITALERLAFGRGKRRRHPPAWMIVASVPKRRGRPPGSKNKPKEETEINLDVILHTAALARVLFQEANDSNWVRHHCVSATCTAGAIGDGSVV